MTVPSQPSRITDRPALTLGDLKSWASANAILDSYPIEDEDGNRPISFDQDTYDEADGGETVVVIRFQD